MSMLSRSDDAAWAENEFLQLKAAHEKLKEELEESRAKTCQRDLSNGKLLGEVYDLQEEMDNLKKQLSVASNAHDNKSMSNIDLTRKIKTCGMEKTALEAQVGRLTNEASVTWQEGMTKFIRDVVKDTMEDREW